GGRHEGQGRRDRGGEQGNGKGQGTAVQLHIGSIARPARLAWRWSCAGGDGGRHATAHGTPRRPPHRNQWTPWPVSGLASGAWRPGRRAFPCMCTVADAAAVLAYRCGGSAGMAASRAATPASPASRFSPWTTVRGPPWSWRYCTGLSARPGRGDRWRSVALVARRFVEEPERSAGAFLLVMRRGHRRGGRAPARRRQFGGRRFHRGHQLGAAGFRHFL